MAENQVHLKIKEYNVDESHKTEAGKYISKSYDNTKLPYRLPVTASEQCAESISKHIVPFITKINWIFYVHAYV
jgi:hypothetical protein